MSRMTLFDLRPILMYLKTLPLEQIVQIRFAVARFLYETATMNGRLNVPKVDEIEAALDTGITPEEVQVILSSFSVRQIPSWEMDDNAQLAYNEISFEDDRILRQIIDLIRKDAIILLHERETMNFSPNYTSDISRIESSLIYAGIDPSETYPIIVSLMGMTMS